MNIVTEADVVGLTTDHALGRHFSVIAYADGALSTLPHRFFRNWLDEDFANGEFQIGRCSGFGVGSIAKYDSARQALRVGRFVSGGMRLRFVLNGQHDMRTISTSLFVETGITPPAQPQCGDTIVKNDVWIGDEAMVLGGAVVENGCVLGARALVPQNFRSEPYGVYLGAPARLKRLRFDERVVAALLELAWWDMPLAWIRRHNACFTCDLTTDVGLALELLAELAASKADALAQTTPAAA